METNAVGFTRMIGCAYRHFANKGGGHIACISSIAGTKGLGPAPAYSATKAMQNTYLQALEQLAACKHHNIHFTDIRPGFVDTPLLAGTSHLPILMTTEKVARSIIKAINSRRHICVIDSLGAYSPTYGDISLTGMEANEVVLTSFHTKKTNKISTTT